MSDSLLKKIREKLSGDRRAAAIVILGIVGILLLVLSELISPANSEAADSDLSKTAAASLSVQEYREGIEVRLAEILSQIEGAGDTRVMVTLEGDRETVYARNESRDTNEEGDYSGDTEYVIVKNGSDEAGLPLTVYEPRILGVAVVCEGGDSFVVKQSITEAVMSLFSIGGSSVSVAKMKTDREELF